MTSLLPVQIAQLPRSVEEFIALRDQVARTPQGGAAMMVVALLLYAEDDPLGRQCLTAAVDRERLVKGSKGYKGWQLRVSDMQLIQSQIRPRPHVPRSYVRGAAPEDNYRLPAPPYVFECSDSPYSGDPDSGRYKVFVACSGASSPRPVTVRRNDQGVWKAFEWSSLLVGVREPVRDQEQETI